MVTKEQKEEYNRQLSIYNSARKCYVTFNVLTAVFGILWTGGIIAGVLYYTFTSFMEQYKINNWFPYACLGICAGCALIFAMGLWTSIYAFKQIDSMYNSIAFGVVSIIFTGIVPGVFYLLALNYSEYTFPTNPEEVDKQKRILKKQEEEKQKEIEKEVNDPRNYFTKDEDDVGEIPDINRVDFEDLKRTFEKDRE